MADATEVKKGSTVELSFRSLLLTALTGFFVGVGIWLLTIALQQWVINPLFCRSDDLSSACSNGFMAAFIFAQLVLHMTGLFVLVNLGVYRPLLVIIAAITALYGIDKWLVDLVWYEAAAWYGFVFAIGYVFFAWLARVTSFVWTLILFAVTLVAVRFLVIWLQ